MKIFFALSLVFLLLLPAPLSANFSQNSEEISANEQKVLRSFVANFFRELEETRDFTTLVDKYFLESLGKCSIGREVLGDKGVPTDKIAAFNLLHIDSKIVKDIPEDLLKRLFISSLNYFHLRFYTPPSNEADDEYKKILTQIKIYIKNDKELQEINLNQVIGSIKQIEAYVLFQEYAFSLTQTYINADLKAAQKKYEKYFKRNETGDYEAIEPSIGIFTRENIENSDFLCSLSPNNSYYSVGISGYYTLVLTQIDNKIKIVAIYPDES